MGTGNHHQLLMTGRPNKTGCGVVSSHRPGHLVIRRGQAPPRQRGKHPMRSADTVPGAPVGRSATALALVLALSVLIAGLARAEDYPDRPVKIIVPFAAGGTADAIPRLVGDWLSRKWGQPVVIENRRGAAGNIGAEYVYHSNPDGYTLLSSPPPPLVINQNLYPKLGFDPARFEPIIVMAHVPNALIVNPRNVKASSVPELVDYLQKNPEQLTAATQGIGTTSHLAAELFQVMAKVKLRFIPSRGSATALQGLLAGDVDLMFDNLGVSLPLVEAGNLKLLAVASAQRLASLPDMPTLAETLPGFEAVAWYAIVAPPGTPKNITVKINADVNEALRQPEVQERLKKLSAETFGGSPEKAAKYMQGEVERWGSVIKAADIKLQ